MGKYQMANKETNIRPYALSDLPFIVSTSVREVPKLPNYKGIEADPDRIEYLLKHNLGNASTFQCWVLVDPETQQLVGGVAGYCVPGMLFWDLVATDVFLFVLPEWRTLRNVVKLMTAYKMWAKSRGCKIINASYTGGYRTEEMAQLMKRQGYVEVGALWMLRLD